ncbi:MAG: glycyl-radical enzyme activating protein [Candidatus Electryonea clarkiae]|nr:glycyl-radical enzyme activating protein [Candidatus Electryonea clarkiae]MDP8285299.1 glycyl-radical enzyme activating protein [Candidatus Electryonea clarkiae]
MGLIFDIKKFAIHDGPGIRTTVFFSGCPLSCQWCHNPECKLPNNDKTQEIDIDHVMDVILSDAIFYDESGGGVTFSGGEPLNQLDFLLSLLVACKKEGIHTALDTCGYAPWDSFERILEYLDLILFDLKLIDPAEHRFYTSVSNELILENLEKLSNLGASLRIRVPLIPGITDKEQNLTGIAKFVNDLPGRHPVDLLPYNLFTRSKYQQTGVNLKLDNLREPSRHELELKSHYFEEYGIETNY